ncbi:response regulator [Candidatus Vondammii sp. HM_W22]|uniref:response regulator n=1 Tax=Candidatus Vondammii sp. HM_W22 TaxID=2687299 RepID=UPI002A4E2501|nr:response regulator [Candidatus Vondammii sp. HM_W22]
MKKILLIDDDEALCELLTEYLVNEAFTVEHVHTGPEGVAQALRGDWDAIILDVMLPGMNGVRCAETDSAICKSTRADVDGQGGRYRYGARS